MNILKFTTKLQSRRKIKLKSNFEFNRLIRLFHKYRLLNQPLILKKILLSFLQFNLSSRKLYHFLALLTSLTDLKDNDLANLSKFSKTLSVIFEILITKLRLKSSNENIHIQFGTQKYALPFKYFQFGKDKSEEDLYNQTMYKQTQNPIFKKKEEESLKKNTIELKDILDKNPIDRDALSKLKRKKNNEIEKYVENYLIHLDDEWIWDFIKENDIIIKNENILNNLLEEKNLKKIKCCLDSFNEQDIQSIKEYIIQNNLKKQWKEL